MTQFGINKYFCTTKVFPNEQLHKRRSGKNQQRPDTEPEPSACQSFIRNGLYEEGCQEAVPKEGKHGVKT